MLFALERAPATLARSLLDGRRRRRRRGSPGSATRVRPARDGAARGRSSRTPSSSSSTSRRPGSRRARPHLRDRCGCASARSRSTDTFETLVDPGVVAASRRSRRLTGIRADELRRARPVELAVRRFLAFAGDAPLVAHNARFDVGFLDRAVERLTGRRVAAHGRRHRLARAAAAASPKRAFALSSSRTSSARRASRATARCPTRSRPRRSSLALLGLAQERGARTTRARSSSSRRRGRAGSTRSGRSSQERRLRRASTSSATATTRCSTSARPATCA